MQRLAGFITCVIRSPFPLLRNSVGFEFTYAPKRSPKQNEDTKTLRARLLYQSKKRGILENDILIGDFADENLEKMSHEELVAYDRLINSEHMEWDLYYYMSGKKEPPSDVASCPVFQKLKKYVAEYGKPIDK